MHLQPFGDIMNDIMKIKNINEIFNIKKGDVISVVGSGGKTTLMFKLAEVLKEEYKVLITTSAKIYKPSIGEYDFLYINMKEYYASKICCNEKNSITVLSNGIDLDKNKLIGINDEELASVVNDFDIILIEADGSRGLPLKGWKSYEPPILNRTNKTIGVIPIDAVNTEINEKLIYGFDEFKKIVGDTLHIDYKAVGKLCSDDQGLFKNSMGERYLYINRTDSEKDVVNSINLAEYLKNNIVGNPYNFKICFGSLKQAVFYET